MGIFRLSLRSRDRRGGERIRERNEEEFDFSRAEIYRAVMDPSSYSQWWPAVIRYRILDPKSKHAERPRIEIRPFGGSRFCCEIESLSENEKIAFNYYEGACLGIGLWRLTPNGEKTLLSYEIDLAIQSRMVRLASMFIDVGRLHSRVVEGIFRGLRTYLKRQRK